MPEGADASGKILLRPMRPSDIEAVMAVEKVSFASNWPSTAFQRELTQNPMARYLVLESDGEVIGFGGLWLMVDEAHVVTVAVAPAHRRAGYGSLIVHGLIQVAQATGMAVATLECRVSNEAARALYGRYGFYEVGTRPHYYADNQEDAVIMTTEELSSEAYQARLQRLDEALRQLLAGAQTLIAEANPSGQ